LTQASALQTLTALEVAQRAVEAEPYLAMPRSERCSRAKLMYAEDTLYYLYVRMGQFACNLAANGDLEAARGVLQMAHELDVDAFWELFKMSPKDFVTVSMLWPLVCCLDGKEAGRHLVNRFAVGEVTDGQGRLVVHAMGADGGDVLRFEHI
jgi:3-methyladenine DNA glycosylase Mpg